jgi:hypothetical protein
VLMCVAWENDQFGTRIVRFVHLADELVGFGIGT